ncbi:MAG: carboxypeptidase-like regulatory domain-containing protein, partial [Pyrinomonadaceae bacterium]|nr:carboxypeptidase-like regulatory domain-containing protein [Pyrinomonadaceae bacterium]
MLKKTFFLIFILAFASAYAQNTNVKVVKPKPVAANAAVNAVTVPTPKKTPRPKPKATPINIEVPTEIYGDPKIEEPPANSTIRGRVYYEDSGRAVKRCSIVLMPKNIQDGGSRDYSGLTDGNGYFQIKNVKAGSYYAIINAPGVVSPLAYADVSKQRDEEGLANAFDSFEAITVNGINDTEVQVPARRGGAISGRVMYDDGDTAIGVNVQILRKVGDKFIPVIPNFSIFAGAMMQGGIFKTDDRGFYRFSGLPTGDYIVKVTEDASHNEDSKQYGRGFDDSIFGGSSSLLTMFYPNVFETSKAQIINLQIGQETTEINITIPNRQTHKIEGKIISGKDKLPIANAKIILKKVGDNSVNFFDFDDRRKPTATTDNEGKFYFTEIPSGSYKITVDAAFSDYYDEKKQIYTGNTVANVPYNSPERAKVKRVKFSKKIQEITV